MSYKEKLEAIRVFYQSGATRSGKFRKEQLKLLKKALRDNEKEIYAALHADLKKSKEEAYISELGLVIAEINEIRRNLDEWMRPEVVSTNFVNFPSKSILYKDPYGVVLVIAPWNYPVLLSLMVAVGAIAAGNCVVVKPSELAPASANIIEKVLSVFPKEYIQVAKGDGSEVINEMMDGFRFDYVFYTGGTTVGRIIYEKAARQLIPVTLELGGKSPCIVEQDANLPIAAKRIVFGKFLNAGQTCVAPDYLLVHRAVKNRFISALEESITAFYGNDPSQCNDYGRIINTKRFDTLVGFISQGHIVYGGKYDRGSLYIAPTILENVAPDAPLMREEIFGPILPMFTFNTYEEAAAIVAQHPDPLAFYVFTTDKQKEADWIGNTSFGGGCVNNTIVHLSNPALPFGGVGNSGLGSYHGKYSFDTFTRIKPVLRTANWLDPFLKYPPFKGRLSVFKRIIR
ncbi:MAG: aldehyde dehydrogenase [Chitinophagaceae bacterium]|nr:aldehyde dehydrogenase [Chitinophagaceae bacterium]MCW5925504.1 aldehyde dehydrogenase [Chitinophagaceae bacterium]